MAINRATNTKHVEQHSDMKYIEVIFAIDAPKELFDDARDIAISMAGEAGFEAFENTDNGMKGYIQDTLWDKESLDAMLVDFPFEQVAVKYDFHDAEYKDWNEEWENEGFEPMEINDRCVVHDGRHLPKHQYEIEIEIDAKLAFGTGQHETTRMIVDYLTTHDIKGKSMLDCGCGTGILSIAALKSGVKHVVGYDIDEWSADNARHNAVINGVDSQFVSMLGDSGIIQPMLNDGTPLFDIITANINRNILIGDMPNTTLALKPGGMMILSGFLIEDKSYLTDAASHYGLWLKEEKTDNGWMMLVFQSSMP